MKLAKPLNNKFHYILLIKNALFQGMPLRSGVPFTKLKYDLDDRSKFDTILKRFDILFTVDILLLHQETTTLLLS